MGTKVEFFFHNRDRGLVSYFNDVSVDTMNLTWNEAVRTGAEVINFTDRNGSRLAIHVKRVEMVVCVPWNGV